MRHYLNWTFSSLFFCLALASCQNQLQIELIDNQILEGNAAIAQAKLPEGGNQSSHRLLYKGNELPYQINGEWVFWKVTSENFKGPFSWEVKAESMTSESQEVKKENGQYAVYMNNTKILGYQMEVTQAPEGVNPAYRRSGYIHPLNTPKGKRLIESNPKIITIIMAFGTLGHIPFLKEIPLTFGIYTKKKEPCVLPLFYLSQMALFFQRLKYSTNMSF